MKKIESIEIQGQLFPIEPAAYKEIEKYLQSIRKHFSRYDSSEIITDIESRIAEKFATEVLTPTHKTITLQDVQLMIEQMGDVKAMESEEIEEESSTAKKPLAEETPPTPIKRRFYRNTDDAFLGGVASGIAAYFNIDPLFVRLFLILTFWIGGYNILIYLILWVLIPEAKTPTEKLQMRGSSVTLSSLERTLKDELNHVPNRAEKLRDNVATRFSPAGEIIRTLLKVGVRIAGVGIILGAITGLVVSFFSLIVVFFNLASPYVDPAIYEIAHVIEGAWLPTLFSSLYMAVALPMIFSLLFGVSLLRLRSVLRLWIVLPLFILWLFSLGTLATLALKFAPAIESKTNEVVARREAEVQSSITERDFALTDFTGVEVGSIGRVVLHTGPFQVKATGHSRSLERLNITKNDQTLIIGEPDHDDYRDENDLCWIGCDTQSTIVHIWAPEFTTITTKDIARIESEDMITSTVPMTLKLHDASRAELQVTTPELNVIQKGVSRNTITGQITTLSAELDDSSRTDLDEAEIQTAKVITRGISRLNLPKLQALEVTTHDSSSVRYPDSTTNVKKELNDVSEINGEQRDFRRDADEEQRSSEEEFRQFQSNFDQE